MSRTGVTLTRFIGETEADGAADFADLLGHIGLAGKLVARDLRRALIPAGEKEISSACA